jgi:hypothetical protein
LIHELAAEAERESSGGWGVEAMRIFLLCFLFGSLGALAGFLLANWARKLPRGIPDHSRCEERFTRMAIEYRHQIHDKEAEIQRLIQGLS